MRISDWSSDVCSSDLPDRTGGAISAGDRNADGRRGGNRLPRRRVRAQLMKGRKMKLKVALLAMVAFGGAATAVYAADRLEPSRVSALLNARLPKTQVSAIDCDKVAGLCEVVAGKRSEEHTSELQSLMRISYAVFCLKKKK